MGATGEDVKKEKGEKERNRKSISHVDPSNTITIPPFIIHVRKCPSDGYFPPPFHHNAESGIDC